MTLHNHNVKNGPVDQGNGECAHDGLASVRVKAKVSRENAMSVMNTTRSGRRCSNTCGRGHDGEFGLGLSLLSRGKLRLIQ